MSNYNTGEEVWKDIKGYEGIYQVSNFGRVKSLDRTVINKLGVTNRRRGKIRSHVLAGRGREYPTVILNKKGKGVRKYVHRLVAKSFIKSHEDKPEVNHIDGNKLNNHVSNLEWCDSSYNKKHAYDNNLRKAPHGEKQGLSKLKEGDVLEIRKLHHKGGRTQKELSKTYGVSQVTVWNIVNRKTWKHI